MTYNYAESTAVVGPLSPVAHPGAFDLCAHHAETVTVPRGWQLVRLITEYTQPPHSDDDLMALARAIRETSHKDVPALRPAQRRVTRPADITQDSPLPGAMRPPVRFSVIEGGDDAAAPQ